MGLLTDSFLIDLSLGLLTLLAVVYYYLSSINTYWKVRGVPYVKPQLLFGNLTDSIFGRRALFQIHHEIYKELRGERFGGFFEMVTPNILIRDPELIKRVLIKDFLHFQDRGFGKVDFKNEPLSSGLSNLSGNQWRYMRHKLTPTFTSGKLKEMFDQIYNCGEHFLEELKKCSDSGKPVEAKTVLSLYTTNVIASCAFGIEFKRDSEHWKIFYNMTSKTTGRTKLELIKFSLILFGNRIANKSGNSGFPNEVNDYFLNIVKSTIDFRKKNNIKRNDFLQLLMSLKEHENNEKLTNTNNELSEEDAYLNQMDYKPVDNQELDLTDEVLTAQSMVFLSAGSESTNTTMHFTLYSIAKNPSIQTKVQEEVDKVLAKHGCWSYETVKEMTYLDQVIQEGYRIHPFAPFLGRVCTKPYQIPGTDIVLEKSQRVTIPVHPIHMDPQYYPNPETFDPDRFKDNNYRPSTKYLPFGDGPRMCIAMRFSLLETKICLAKILSQYSVSVNERTVEPLQYDPNSFLPQIIGGIWLNFQKREITA